MSSNQAFNDYMKEVDSLINTKDALPSITVTKDTLDRNEYDLEDVKLFELIKDE